MTTVRLSRGGGATEPRRSRAVVCRMTRSASRRPICGTYFQGGNMNQRWTRTVRFPVLVAALVSTSTLAAGASGRDGRTFGDGRRQPSPAPFETRLVINRFSAVGSKLVVAHADIDLPPTRPVPFSLRPRRRPQASRSQPPRAGSVQGSLPRTRRARPPAARLARLPPLATRASDHGSRSSADSTHAVLESCSATRADDTSHLNDGTRRAKR